MLNNKHLIAYAYNLKSREDQMFNKRRSEIQIIGKILDLSQNGAKKTEILYQSNMSFSQLENYLTHLLEKDVMKENIVQNGNGAYNKVYVTTEKGKDLLGHINKLFTYFE